MASIAEMLVNSGLQSSQQAPDFAGSIQKGAELAQTVENIKRGREQMEQAKQQLLKQKIEKVAGMYETAGKMEGRAQKFMYDKAIPNTAKAFGVGDYFPEATHQILSSTPHAVPYLVGEVRKNPEQFGKIMTALQDKSGETLGKLFPEMQKFGALSEIVANVGEETKQLDEAHKYGSSQEGLDYRAKLNRDAAAARQTNSQTFTASQDDKKKAETYAKQLVDRNIPNITVTLDKLDKNVIPGGIDGYKGEAIQGIGGAQNLIPAGRLSKQGRANRQYFQDLSNDYIKMQTGAGMNIEEAVRLANSIGFDMAIGEGGGVKALFTGQKTAADMVRGVKNLRDKMNEMTSTLKAGAGPVAVQYYEQNKAAFMKKPAKKFKDLSKAQQDAEVKMLASKLGKSEDEIRKQLESK